MTLGQGAARTPAPKSLNLGLGLGANQRRNFLQAAQQGQGAQFLGTHPAIANRVQTRMQPGSAQEARMQRMIGTGQLQQRPGQASQPPGPVPQPATAAPPPPQQPPQAQMPPGLQNLNVNPGMQSVIGDRFANMTPEQQQSLNLISGGGGQGPQRAAPMGSMGPGGMNMAPQYGNMMRSWDSMQGGGWSGGTSQYNAPPAPSMQATGLYLSPEQRAQEGQRNLQQMWGGQAAPNSWAEAYARGYPQPGGQMGGMYGGNPWSGGQAGQLGARTLGGADEMSQLLSGPGNSPLSQQTPQVGGGFQGGGWGTPQPQMQTMPQARMGQFGGMMPAGQGGQRQDWMRPGAQSFGGMLGGFAPGAVPQAPRGYGYTPQGQMRQQSQMQGGQQGFF
jgi:hypothetical protein